MRLFKRVAIIGVGLIGGSIGLAIKKKGLAKEVIGIGRRRKSLLRALRIGAIDEGYLTLRKIKDADLVILAAPVSQIIKSLPRLHKFINNGCVVIDVGSTKSEIISLAAKSQIEFVGCHPLAGMEKGGAQNAKSGIFKNSLCLLVPLKDTSEVTLDKIQRFWRELGARTEILDAGSHDRILAFVSHLPHAVVFALIDCLKLDYLSYAASGLKDTTRIGLSEPLLWRDIFLTNRKELIKAIKKFKNSLARLEFFLKSNQPRKLGIYLKKARDKSRTFILQRRFREKGAG